MRVVSNTSPLSNLAVIGRLPLLRERYGQIFIPPEVWQELVALRHPSASGALRQAVADGWLLVDGSASSVPLTFPVPLDPGEAAAITLAVNSRAGILLIDEQRGRMVARTFALTVAGLLGELLHAKRVGKLPSLRLEIQRLRQDAGFFISVDLEHFILSEAGE